ncbi:MAG: MoaD/ThiS family protein [Firmicutes bacterium]|nr:MoaD/ThiS family protein [Bacillota bacterium]
MAIIEYYGELRSYTGCTREGADVSSLRSVFRYIREHYGRDAEALARKCAVIVDGVNYNFCARQQRVLHQDTVLALFPPVAGG